MRTSSLPVCLLLSVALTDSNQLSFWPDTRALCIIGMWSNNFPIFIEANSFADNSQNASIGLISDIVSSKARSRCPVSFTVSWICSTGSLNKTSSGSTAFRVILLQRKVFFNSCLKGPNSCTSSESFISSTVALVLSFCSRHHDSDLSIEVDVEQQSLQGTNPGIIQQGHSKLASTCFLPLTSDCKAFSKIYKFTLDFKFRCRIKVSLRILVARKGPREAFNSPPKPLKTCFKLFRSTPTGILQRLLRIFTIDECLQCSVGIYFNISEIDCTLLNFDFPIQIHNTSNSFRKESPVAALAIPRGYSTLASTRSCSH